MRELRVNDLTFNSDHVVALIRRQKNDPLGRGMKCFIPAVPGLGDACPMRLLTQWRQQRLDLWPQHGDGALFCVSHLKDAKPISHGPMRKALASVFSSESTGTHSLRKGGAHWYKVDCRVPEEIIQAQGGWCGPDTMRAIYARFDEQERCDLLRRAAGAVSL